jgi:2-C-methyl-D-erythritol 2,4-cyclodiphosphate synthase
MRIGFGFDAHPFTTGRKLILGGVEIAHPEGLLGHSDADVLTHAIIDALLGAAGLPDIGSLFRDTDPEHRDVSSLVLLAETWRRVQQRGFKVANLDATIVCELPRISRFSAAMKAKLSPVLGLDASCISIKGKTTERMGFTGRQEGVACYAVVLLESQTT